MPLIKTCHVINDCSPGTSHFLVVAAVNADGGLVARSEQLTVQTSAPVKQPALQLRYVSQLLLLFSFHEKDRGFLSLFHFILLLFTNVTDKLIRFSV